MKSNEVKKIKGNTILRCENISKSYDGFVVLDKVSFSLRKGENIGLVGRNGVGKSTLLKVCVGVEKSDSGKIHTEKTIGYVPQELSRDCMGKTVEEYVNSIRKETKYDNSTESLLSNIGLPANILERKIAELSGGEKSKLSLLRILVSPYDVLLLDEPTNNLDLPALAFLENFIKKSKKAFVIISHDRKFLDGVVGKIIEINEWSKGVNVYDGNFSEYWKEKQNRISKEWGEYKNAQEKNDKLNKAAEKRIKLAEKLEKPIRDKKYKKWKNPKATERIDATVLRERSGKAGHQAKVLSDRIERQKINDPEKPKTNLPLKLNFEISERSGNKVFELKTDKIDFSVQYGDRILIVGPNGAGKTTLLKKLIEATSPQLMKVRSISNDRSPTSIIGSRVRIGYLPQEEEWELDNTILTQFLNETKKEENDARKILNRFRFGADDILKKLSDISPGERSRLILAILMAQDVNCLILDEPSNHLDIEALDQLEKALREYKGTLIVVAHDRYFIENINIDKTLVLQGGVLKEVVDYHEYEKLKM